MTGAMAVLAALLAAAAATLAVGGRRPLPRRDPAGPLPRPPRPPRIGGGTAAAAGGPVAVSPGLRLAMSVGAGSAVLMLVPGSVGLLGAGAAAAVAWWRSGTLEPAAARRRRELVDAELPHVVDLLLALVAVGGAPGEALSRVAEVSAPEMRAELSVWVRRLALGADPVQVWRDLSAHPQLGRLGRTLHRSAESGAPVQVSLEHLAEDLRQRRRADTEARVRQVEVRASIPLGVCLLPAFVLVGVVPLVAGAATGLLGVAR